MKLKSILSELERKNMPQISKSDLPEAMKLLQDNGVNVTIGMYQPDQLHHSQRAVNKEKVRSIIKEIKSGKVLPPIIISSDFYIIDGHHRWLAYRLLKTPIKCIRIELPQRDAIIEFKKIELLMNK